MIDLYIWPEYAASAHASYDMMPRLFIPCIFFLIESDRTAFLEAVTENKFPADERDELGSVETYGQNALLTLLDIYMHFI